MKRCLIIPIFILASMIFSLRCGWFGPDFLKENKTSVACRILCYGKKHGIISKQLDIRFYISFQIINVNKK